MKLPKRWWYLPCDGSTIVFLIFVRERRSIVDTCWPRVKRTGSRCSCILATNSMDALLWTQATSVRSWGALLQDIVILEPVRCFGIRLLSFVEVAPRMIKAANPQGVAHPWRGHRCNTRPRLGRKGRLLAARPQGRRPPMASPQRGDTHRLHRGSGDGDVVCLVESLAYDIEMSPVT
ncbi:hypothetical protein GW17_00050433 [Ensete ventricosum]|nr:hypothetical protein GW17_00050433 [Ensete ventricosum]